MKFMFTFFILLSVGTARSQNIEVTNDQGLAFGSFCQFNDSGGTATVSNAGVRSSTGAIILLSSTFFHSIFTITTDDPSPVQVNIDQPVATLSGSNGGSISLQLDQASSPSVSAGSPAEVYIGGTLTLGPQASNPPGHYTGDVLVTFTVNNE
jgi:hypothetical protein